MLEAIIRTKRERRLWVVIIAALAIVSFWRGVWGLMDLYMFPENEPLSFSISVVIGLIILYSIRKSF